MAFIGNTCGKTTWPHDVTMVSSDDSIREMNVTTLLAQCTLAHIIQSASSIIFHETYNTVRGKRF